MILTNFMHVNSIQVVPHMSTLCKIVILSKIRNCFGRRLEHISNPKGRDEYTIMIEHLSTLIISGFISGSLPQRNFVLTINHNGGLWWYYEWYWRTTCKISQVCWIEIFSTKIYLWTQSVQIDDWMHSVHDRLWNRVDKFVSIN